MELSQEIKELLAKQEEAETQLWKKDIISKATAINDLSIWLFI